MKPQKATALMIEREEYVINVDQLVADIDEKVRTIDEHIMLVKHMLNVREITYAQDQALFYAMNLMLKERKGLMELKERALLGALREQVVLDNAS